MIPKVIHLCWFSNDPFPVEIKVCIDTWKRLLPDYTIRRWTYEDAKAIGNQFVNEALALKKWAFAADVIRFYALYKEGGVYMDSDIYLYKRFDEFIVDSGFATFTEVYIDNINTLGLQAAFMIGEKGNSFCKNMMDYYKDIHFKQADGSLDLEVSPLKMAEIAFKYGYNNKNTEQHLDGLVIYPREFMLPANHFPYNSNAIGVHRICGSWRTRKFGRKIEIAVKHYYHIIKYLLIKK